MLYTCTGVVLAMTPDSQGFKVRAARCGPAGRWGALAAAALDASALAPLLTGQCAPAPPPCPPQLALVDDVIRAGLAPAAAPAAAPVATNASAELQASGRRLAWLDDFREVLDVLRGDDRAFAGKVSALVNNVQESAPEASDMMG